MWSVAISAMDLIKSPGSMQHAVDLFRLARQLFVKGQFAQARQLAAQYRSSVKYTDLVRFDRRDSHVCAVSFVLVVYQGTCASLACIDELLSQSSKCSADGGGFGADIIVVDNGNCEHLHAELATRPILHILCPENFGPSEARNIGAYFSGSRSLAFVDDDGMPAPDYVSCCLNGFDDPNVIGVRGRVLQHGGAADAPAHYDLGECRVESRFNVEGNMVIKRSVFRAVGGFDPLMFGHEGNELTDRCHQLLQSSKIFYEPSLVIYHQFATGNRLLEKRKRQELGLAYRQWLASRG